MRYIVPQCVTSIGEELRLFFRADNVYQGAVVRVLSGNEELQKKNRRIVTPGEMETVVLSREELSRLGGEITIEVELKS